MRNFLISFLLATLIMIPAEIFASDYETPHEFSAGDTISADMMNELFQCIERSLKELTIDDIIGSWSCVSIANAAVSTCNTDIFNSNNAFTGWSKDSDSLYWHMENTLTISEDGDGTHSYTTSTPNGLRCNNASSETGAVNVSQGLIFFKGTFGNLQYIIRQISPTKIVFGLPSMSGFSNPYAMSLSCNKQNLPPTTPATLTASASGKTVSLAWTDSSTDETGFKVLRKDSITGSYSTVTTTSADATSYSDTVTTAGSYWYRVSATNSNGDSVASKMVKVDVE